MYVHKPPLIHGLVPPHCNDTCVSMETRCTATKTFKNWEQIVHQQGYILIIHFIFGGITCIMAILLSRVCFNVIWELQCWRLIQQYEGDWAKMAWVQSWKPLMTKRKTKARLTFTIKHLDDPQDFWKTILWTDKAKGEHFRRCAFRYMWRKTNTAIQKKNIILTVKRGGGVTVWGCFVASGSGRLAAQTKQGQSRQYPLKKLGSFGVQGALLTSFYDSVAASAIFYRVVCWSSGISAADRRRIDLLIKKASSILGCPLDPVQVVGESRMMDKLSSLLVQESHPLQVTLTALGSSFSNRLIHPKCVKER